MTVTGSISIGMFDFGIFATHVEQVERIRKIQSKQGAVCDAVKLKETRGNLWALGNERREKRNAIASIVVTGPASRAGRYHLSSLARRQSPLINADQSSPWFLFYSQYSQCLLSGRIFILIFGL
ncbi:hypothetical protein V6N13_086649 [Hibiscus sabdariffa]|uniref:Uncharacterized protein n=1 Tax=Hibiscus sabdariffa TaxID=183260 RepID=A0ABR2FU41_9ROSI